MDIKLIQKYKNRKISWLISNCQKYCNEYIRLRDANKPCISCGKFEKLQAGHLNSAGHTSALRFNENNIFGQCLRCNYYLHGNLSNYRIKIVERIGEDGLKELDNLVAIYKRGGFKWDRFTLIEKIQYYKNKIFELSE